MSKMSVASLAFDAVSELFSLSPTANVIQIGGFFRRANEGSVVIIPVDTIADDGTTVSLSLTKVGFRYPLWKFWEGPKLVSIKAGPHVLFDSSSCPLNIEDLMATFSTAPPADDGPVEFGRSYEAPPRPWTTLSFRGRKQLLDAKMIVGSEHLYHVVGSVRAQIYSALSVIYPDEFITEESSPRTLGELLRSQRALDERLHSLLAADPSLETAIRTLHDCDGVGKCHIRLSIERVLEMPTMEARQAVVHACFGDIFQIDPERELMDCYECGSSYFAKSCATRLCQECAHQLYYFPACDHIFENHQCVKCGWDGSRSEQIRSLIDSRS